MSSLDDSIVVKKYRYKELKPKDENEATIILPTEEDIKNSDTMYLFIENSHGARQFVPIDCKDLKKLIICNSKKDVLERFNSH